MSKRPWYPLYTGDLRRKTEHLSPEELGCYIRLMNHYWDNGGPITAEPARLCRIMGIDRRRFKMIESQIGGYFVTQQSDSGNTLLLPRLQEELEKTIRISEVKASAGKKGGQAYARTHAQAKTEHMSTHSHSHKEEQEHMSDSDESDGFAELWKEKPKRPNQSKPDARKAYNARLRDTMSPATHADLLEGLRRYNAFCEAEKTQPRFTKHLATFLGTGEHWKKPYEIIGKVPTAEVDVQNLIDKLNLDLPANCKLFDARKLISEQTGMAL